MRALLTEELLRLGTAQARAAEEQATTLGEAQQMLRVEVELQLERCELHEKKAPGCLGYIGDDILPSYVLYMFYIFYIF